MSRGATAGIGLALAAACHAPDTAAAEACGDSGWCTGLPGDGTLALDASLRLRSLHYDPARIGTQLPGDDYGLLRALFSADLRRAGWQAFAQLGVHGERGRDGGPGGTDRGALDLQQGYLAWRSTRARLRVGRQEVSLGSARLVSVRDGPNIRLAFDGLRWTWQGPRLRLDLLALRPVDNRVGAFDDRSDRRTYLVGTDLDWPARTGAPGSGIETYLLGYGRDGARFAATGGDERRTSLGVRLYGTQGPWDWNTEMVLQRGTLDSAAGNLAIRAWTVASDTGYRSAAWPWRARIGLKADIASGDDNLRDSRLQTFNALFPKAAYFSEASLLAPANLIDLQPTLTLVPRADISTQFGVQWAWKHRRADAVYVTPAPLTPLPRSAGGSRVIGRQYKWETAWRASDAWQWQLHLAWLEAGPGLRDAGARDTFFASILGAWQW